MKYSKCVSWNLERVEIFFALELSSDLFTLTFLVALASLKLVDVRV
jgi:hypothetical protein